ncbi:hypothetical protein NM208_g9183 [Fusarium decemcellulare]|uniref:Uncharacterized protein n=1 Tax=Fusarium decemcellulare TaxID=57161 RepID=A0ACC1S2N4_9HYPO|nr:hypothetical protein NM208_g9183 [Fusarium decemcellulare]
MASSFSLSQASLAAAILASTAGTYIALSPPNPSTHSQPSTGDSIRWLHLTSKHTTKVVMAPVGLLAAHASALSFFYPNIPSTLLRNGAENGLNTSLITWSPATLLPLAGIFFAGIPLRLVPYSTLGKNFTFALKEPDRLTTTGIYRYVQHPSYTAIFLLIICNISLLARVDGILSCWIPPQWYHAFRLLGWSIVPLGLSMMAKGLSARVREEEVMLRDKFKLEWENWHSKTARFIPWLL